MAVQAWFERRFKNHLLLIGVIGTHFDQNDKLKTTMNIPNIDLLVDLARKHAISVVGVKLIMFQNMYISTNEASLTVSRLPMFILVIGPSMMSISSSF